MADRDVAEIVKRVRRVQIVANKTVNDLFAGEYHSVFRGRGMEFDEVREYQPGDDIRTIDWNVTARAGAPFVKRFREERELTVLFLVDISASGVFGSGDRAKIDLAIEVAALLMFSALKNNDKVGLMLFCDEVLKYLPPRKGKGPVLRFLRELVAADPVSRPTRIDTALTFLNKVQRRRAVVFLISDFQAPEFEKPLVVANGRHDLIAVSVHDPRERELPDVGFLSVEDAETGDRVEIDTGSRRVRELYRAAGVQQQEALRGLFRKVGVDQLDLSTQSVTAGGRTPEYIKSMHRFFRMRERRRR